MDITKINAARSQLATAIQLYFEDRDPISVHTLAMAAAEIIDRLCTRSETVSIRDDMLATIHPARRGLAKVAWNSAQNFFKHADPGKPDVLLDFSEERNLFAILMAAYGLRLLNISMIEARVFEAWLRFVEPQLFVVPLADELARKFGYLSKEPRSLQKKAGRDTLQIALTGELPRE